MLNKPSLWILWIALASFSHKLYALNFNEYCPFSAAEQDCSTELLSALLDAANTKEPISFSEGSSYRIDQINTQGLFLSGISLVGEGRDKPIIHTDGIYLFDTSELLVENINIKGIHNGAEDTEQGNTLMLLGTRDHLNKQPNITVNNVDFENAAEDLLVLWNTRNVTVKNSSFTRSGLAMRTVSSAGDPNDLRPRGSGLLFHNVIDLNVSFNEFYQIKKVGIFLDGEDLVDRNIKIHDNYIDLLSDEKPTLRYGLKGGAGIYLANSIRTEDAEIFNNRILNYHMNGMRINGKNIQVFNNLFNFHGGCQEMDNSISLPLVGMAVKAHFLIDSEITNNCIQNTHSGIVLESWDEISNILVKNNYIYGAKVDFWVEDQEGGTSSNINISENTLANNSGEDKNSNSGGASIMLTLLCFVRIFVGTATKKRTKTLRIKKRL